MEIELAAQKRIYDAIIPLIESRQRSDAIMHAANKANMGELTRHRKEIVKQLMHIALQRPSVGEAHA